jgi:hypothetical protein
MESLVNQAGKIPCLQPSDESLGYGKESQRYRNESQGYRNESLGYGIKTGRKL